MAAFQLWHWLSLGVLALLAIAATRRSLPTYEILLRSDVRRLAGLVILAVEIAWFTLGTVNGTRGWRKDLPLHLCDLGLLALLWALIVRPEARRYPALVYFLALPGTALALLVPEIDPPGPLQILAMVKFFFTHGLTLVLGLHLARVEAFRPGPRSIVISWLQLLGIAALVAPINYALGTNYIFVNSPTTAVEWFSKIPFPTYLSGYALVMLETFCLVALGLGFLSLDGKAEER